MNPSIPVKFKTLEEAAANRVSDDFDTWEQQDPLLILNLKINPFLNILMVLVSMVATPLAVVVVAEAVVAGVLYNVEFVKGLGMMHKFAFIVSRRTTCLLCLWKHMLSTPPSSSPWPHESSTGTGSNFTPSLMPWQAKS